MFHLKNAMIVLIKVTIDIKLSFWFKYKKKTNFLVRCEVRRFKFYFSLIGDLYKIWRVKP